MAYNGYERGFALGHRDSLRGFPMNVNLSWVAQQQQGYKDGYYAGSRAMAARSWSKNHFQENEGDEDA